MNLAELPTPILGEVTAITITTTDLEASLTYYQRLGFKEVSRFDFPFPWIQVSDGVLLIMLRKDPKPYIALTYYVNSIENVASALEVEGIVFAQKPGASDMVPRYLIHSPDGMNISLVKNMDGFFIQPAGPRMLNMPQQDYFNPDKYVNKTCGLFGEFAHPVKDLDASIAFWDKLGFKAVSKFTSPYPWAIITDGLGVVGLHQTDNFSYPAITYFASDMKAKISRLLENGLDNYTEKGNTGNIVLNTPEGQHINLFGLGM